MPIFHKTIFTGFAPNLTGRDALTALAYLFLPWRWGKILSGRYPELAEEKLRRYFQVKHAYAFDSGRSALYYGLKALGAGAGDEILVQAYTCVVVINAIKWTGAKPVFIDISRDFNLDPAALENKITAKTKIIIIQHTFGRPARLDEILAIARKHHLKIIEDCAHSLGARYRGKLTGSFGDLGMLSFGSDKIISSARGGALITNNDELGQKIKNFCAGLARPNLPKTIQHLWHFPIFYTAKPIYHLFIGKFILILAKKFNILNRIIYRPEKMGKPVKFYPARLANALAHILNFQLDEIDALNAHRQKISKIYQEKINQPLIKLPWREPGIILAENACLRYPLLSRQADKLTAYAKKRGIILGDWYNSVIAPKDVSLKETGYRAGECPTAESLAAQSVNLPTDRRITEKQALRIIDVINSFIT